MGIVWWLISLPIATLSCSLILGHFQLPIWALWIYAWLPGALALLWSRIKKTKIPLLPIKKIYLLWALLGGFVFGAVSFFISQFVFATTFTESPSIKNAVLYFFSYYIVITLSLCLLFIGGEFCWRGYLWERWKKHPFKGGIGIWLLWSMWLAPETFFLFKNVFSMLFLNLALMPFLHYLRLKSLSITPGTIFYSSLCASSIYFQVLFSSIQEHPHLSILQASLLIITALAYVLINKEKNLPLL